MAYYSPISKKFIEACQSSDLETIDKILKDPKVSALDLNTPVRSYKLKKVF